MLSGPPARAVQLATELRKDLGLDQRLFDLEAQVRDMGILVVKGRLPGGLEGLSCSIRYRDTIILSDACVTPERQRFTLGHELGHTLLSHTASGCCASSVHGLGLDECERAANAFATSLLMPARLFRSDIKRVSSEFPALGLLAANYRVSLTAAALRFVQFTKDACVLLWFPAGETAAWFRKSDSAEPWFVRDAPLGGSLLENLSQEDCSGLDHVSAACWLENYTRADSWQLREEVLKIGTWGHLVLLSDLPDEEEDPELMEEQRALDDLERRRNSFRMY